MSHTLTRWLRFRLERWIQRGAFHQLLLMGGLIVFISVGGGLVASAATESFDSIPSAMWWAFLRLTDPGYLGDDQGAALRIVSTTITILGYVVFMGTLIAILTQWLARTIRVFETGLTPVSMQDHIAILGWTNRTPEIVVRLLGARGRLMRFLGRIEVSKLRVVILAQTVDAAHRLELRQYLGALWSESQIVLRSGSSLQREHLGRLDLSRAAVIIVPGSDFELGGAEVTDTRVVKTLLSIEAILSSSPGERRPYVVAEIRDPLKVPIARNTMTEGLDILASDNVIGRLISQSIRHPGLSQVFLQILSHRQGNSLYIRAFPQFEGMWPMALNSVFPRAVVMGVVRRDEKKLYTSLNPSPSMKLRTDDLLVLLAKTYDDCEPRAVSESGWPACEPIALRASDASPQHILLLGWNYKIATLIAELDACRPQRFDITIMSRVTIEERQGVLRRVPYDSERVNIAHLEGDYSLPSELESVDVFRFDNILFLASAIVSSSEEADARTILGHVLLRALLEGHPRPPGVLVELLDPDNADLFSGSETVLISPRLLSHILAHVALRPELNSVFEELFRSGGPEIELRNTADYGLSKRTVCFNDVQRLAAEHGEVALGLYLGSADGGGLDLNPSRDQPWGLRDRDRFVVLAGRTTDRGPQGV